MAPTPTEPVQSAIYYYHPDHLGTSTFLTDANGNAYQFFINLPFGETMAEQLPDTYYRTPFKFNGKELDEETGLYYYGARYYDPKISIWLSVDPLAESFPNWNPYNYCLQNPINMIDPDGRAPEDIIVTAKDGTKLFTLNDGDNGIYLADKDGNWDIKKSQSIGYKTLNPFDFMIPNDQTGEFDRGFEPVTFNPKKLADGGAIWQKYVNEWDDMITNTGFPTSQPSMLLLASLSRNNAYFDIKENYPVSSGGYYTPVILIGNTITTVRALGNIIFGTNMRTVFDKSWNTMFQSPDHFYNLYMRPVGKYNQKQNNGNGYNSGFPFYGEHTYSGTNIYSGYFMNKP